MFTTRLISGIVLVIIAAFLLVEGSAVLYFGSMAISLIGLYELYRVMKIERSAPVHDQTVFFRLAIQHKSSVYI